MNYSKKDIIIGFVIILIIVLVFFFFKKGITPKVNSKPTPETINYRQLIEDSFNLNIPDDVETINLVDISGGDGKGIASKEELLADLSDPKEGYFYQAWLEKSNGDLISLGKMQFAKGGWMIEYDKTKYLDISKIIVSLENKFDNKIEFKILEGSF